MSGRYGPYVKWEKVNATLSNYERIKKIVIVPDELTVENGALTPSLKIKRKVVEEHYRDAIEAMYAER